ncbi:MAG: lactate utilization protein, partial [Acutalibacteraceae bacterium]
MSQINMQSVNKTLDSLRKNNMEAYFCENSEKARELVKSLMKKGTTVSHGGSVTLAQTGITDILKNGDYNYLDRSTAGSREEIEEIYRKTFSADVFLTSANAITENGELYNVDGNSNRVAAILYGPESVIVIAGYNKIVPDINAAVKRVKEIAAPLNTKRLECDTYCAKENKCVSLNNDNSFICDGCHSEQRICCNYVISAQQRKKNRIKVIIVGEELGY